MPEPISNVLSGRWADVTEWIGTRRGDWGTSFSNQCLCHRMVRHSDRDRREPGGDEIRYGRPSWQHQRQRTRPEQVHEPLPQRWQGSDHNIQLLRIGDVDDEWIELRTLLCFEDLRRRIGIHRIAAESIDRFGWKRDESACFDDPSSERDGLSICYRADGTVQLIGLHTNEDAAPTPDHLLLHGHHDPDGFEWVVLLVARDTDDFVDHLDPTKDLSKHRVAPIETAVLSDGDKKL